MANPIGPGPSTPLAAAVLAETAFPVTVIPPADGPAPYLRGGEFTYGPWEDEAAAAAAFDLAVGTDLFMVFREVPGTLLHPRPGQIERSVRIDRVLMPTQQLITAGWKHGAVGVEIKRSGVKIGTAVAQAMDYSRSAWTLAGCGGARVLLDYVFIWPMAKQQGPVASILAQNRIGSATGNAYTRFQFKTGETNILCVERDGRLRLGDGRDGARVGSR